MFRRSHFATALAVMATAAVVGCNLRPAGTTSGGQLGLRIEWPFRVQAIPTNTAAVAVAVFRDGRLVRSPSGKNLTIIGNGGGSVTYRGLDNGDYRVVSVAFSNDVTPLAGAAAPARVDTNVSPRTQVVLDLQESGTGAVGELSSYLNEVHDYLNAAKPSPEPSPLPSTAPDPGPTPGTGSPDTPTPGSSSVPTPDASATPASSGGGGTSSSPSGLVFTGGF